MAPSSCCNRCYSRSHHLCLVAHSTAGSATTVHITKQKPYTSHTFRNPRPSIHPSTHPRSCIPEKRITQVGNICTQWTAYLRVAAVGKLAHKFLEYRWGQCGSTIAAENVLLKRILLFPFTTVVAVCRMDIKGVPTHPVNIIPQ